MAEALSPPRPLDGIRRGAARARLRAAALWRSHPRETVGVGLLGLISAGALASVVAAPPGLTESATAAPPAPPPLIMREVAPQEALKINAAIPVAQGPNPAAAPFVFKGDSAARRQALECLASAVYYEAGQESDDGQRAVAQVVLNRVRHPAFAGTVCGVVYEGSTRPTGCQFTFTCDGSLYRQPDSDGWRRAWRVAEAALKGYVHAPVGLATHYHANYVLPYWASSLAKNAIVGAHIFYRWSGGWGQPAAFSRRHAGREPDARALRSAALAAEHVANPATAVAEAVKDIPGAEEIKLVPSMRGDKRVGVRFNLAAREASDKIQPEAYVRKFAASDNLSWTLSSESVASGEKPLGKPAAEPAAPAPSAGGATGATAQP